MASQIFLKSGDDLIPMNERAYEKEVDLQVLLARYPGLLSGDPGSSTVTSGEPRRWLLVGREVGVPDHESGPGRWSVDHFFLDQEAVPTLVEVKRSTDTRIRREVVGQMLDYAAGAAAYWHAEELRTLFEATCEDQGVDPDLLLADLLGGGTSGYAPLRNDVRDYPGSPSGDPADTFWARVEDNLRAGRLRLVFVADVIPPELRRIVEFLNEQMDATEVVAVEVRQYAGAGQQIYVSRTIGQTAAAQARKHRSHQNRTWDEAAFFDTLQARGGDAAVRVARRLLDWARERTLLVTWRGGRQDGAYRVWIAREDGSSLLLCVVWTYDKVRIQAAKLADAGLVQRDELDQRLQAIPSLRATEKAERPSIPLATLDDEVAWQAFEDVLNWILVQIPRAQERIESD